jgi:hypothetical protein
MRRELYGGQQAIEFTNLDGVNQVWWVEVWRCPSCRNRTTGKFPKLAVTEQGKRNYREWVKVLDPIKCWNNSDEKEAWQMIKQLTISLPVRQDNNTFAETPCEWHFDVPSPGLKTLFRLDTGEEIEVTQMSESDPSPPAPG